MGNVLYTYTCIVIQFNWDSLHARLISQPLRDMELQEIEAQKS